MSPGREPDNPEIKKAWAKSKEYSRNVIENNEPGAYVNDSQPRCGKTYNLAEVISETSRSIAFFTANHDHIKDFKEDLEHFGVYEGEKGYIHGKGFERSCKIYLNLKKKKRENWTDKEKLVYNIYNGFGVKSARFLCSNCKYKPCKDKKDSKPSEECEYYNYTHNANKYRITLQPLEFLFTNYNDDKDIFVVDETINKKETLIWDFNLKKLNKFISDIKEFSEEDYYILEQYVEELTNFHKTIIQENSLIFKESPDTLFKMNDKTFKGKDKEKDGIFQYKNYIIHPGKIRLINFDDAHRDLFYLLYDKKFRGIIDYTDEQIRNVIKKGVSDEIDRLIENYIPLWHCLQIFEILFCNAFKEVYFLMSEKLTIQTIKDLRPLEKIKTEDNYEYGFTAELFPYIHNTETGDCVISKMGKSYEKEKPLELHPDAWFTLGHPYVFQVFNKTKEKPVIFLDATYNKKIFDKMRYDWRSTHRIKKFIIEEQDQPTIPGKVDRIERPTITNPNSTLYVVDSRSNSSYPLSSLIDKDGKITKPFKKVIGSIITIIEENPGKKINHISQQKTKRKIDDILGENENDTYYYNLRGKNIDCEILIVIGTPYIPPIDLLYDYILTFNESPKSTKPIRTDKKFEGYKDEELNNFFQSRVFEELYQALHRNAPLIWNRIIILFGKVPDRIEAELTVKHIKLENISNEYIYKTMDEFIRNENIPWSKFYSVIYRWKIFDKKYEPRHFLDKLEKEGIVTAEMGGTKKNPKLLINFTKKAKSLYKKYNKLNNT